MLERREGGRVQLPKAASSSTTSYDKVSTLKSRTEIVSLFLAESVDRFRLSFGRKSNIRGNERTILGKKEHGFLYLASIFISEIYETKTNYIAEGRDILILLLVEPVLSKDLTRYVCDEENRKTKRNNFNTVKENLNSRERNEQKEGENK